MLHLSAAFAYKTDFPTIPVRHSSVLHNVVHIMECLAAQVTLTKCGCKVQFAHKPCLKRVLCTVPQLVCTIVQLCSPWRAWVPGWSAKLPSLRPVLWCGGWCQQCQPACFTLPRC